MTTETNIIKRDSPRIENELQNLDHYRKIFQTFFDALVKHNYIPDTNEFKALVYRRYDREQEALKNFVRDQMVSSNAALKALPISKSSLELPSFYPEILGAYLQIRMSTDDLRRVDNFHLSGPDVVLNNETRQNIIDEYTTYGDDLEMEALAEGKKIFEALEAYYNKYQRNPIVRGLIAYHANSGAPVFIPRAIKACVKR